MISDIDICRGDLVKLVVPQSAMERDLHTWGVTLFEFVRWSGAGLAVCRSRHGVRWHLHPEGLVDPIVGSYLDDESSQDDPADESDEMCDTNI